MKKLFTKSFMIVVAILTFGFISPNHELWEDILNEPTSTKNGSYTALQENTEVSPFLPEEHIESTLDVAKEQAYIKFGDRIKPKIEMDFDHQIYPKIEKVMTAYFDSLPNEEVRYMKISEQPAGDYGEKIFNLYDERTKKDVIRFHVRCDQRPKDGFYYNFHYHTIDDDYTAHIELGEIFWSKNKPPKWLS